MLVLYLLVIGSVFFLCFTPCIERSITYHTIKSMC